MEREKNPGRIFSNKLYGTHSKDLVKKSGILSSPNPKHGCTLPTGTIKLVQSYYELDEVSRIMPGKKYFVSIREGDHRVHVQKRLILGNLKEVYQHFKEKYPMEKVGFSNLLASSKKLCSSRDKWNSCCMYLHNQSKC